MSKISSFKLRPYKQGHDELKDVFKIHATQPSLNQANLRHRDMCQLEGPDGRLVAGEIAETQRDIQNKVVQVTQAFKELHGLKYEESYVLKKSEAPVEQIDSVTITERPAEDGMDGGNSTGGFGQLHPEYWNGFIASLLYQTRFVCLGLLLGDVVCGAERKSFKVTAIMLTSGRLASLGELYRFCQTSRVFDQKRKQRAIQSNLNTFNIDSPDAGIGGLGAQLARLNREMARYKSSSRTLKKSRGIVLHGPSGTGKTLLLEKVAEAPWRKVVKLESPVGSTQATTKLIEKAFSDVYNVEPSAIFLDNLETFSSEQTLVRSLMKGFKSIRGSRVLVLAATRSLRDIDTELQGASAFKVGIELPVPDAQGRLQILKALCTQEDGIRIGDILLNSFSEKAHGYTGGDLQKLLDIAIEKAEDRLSEAAGQPNDVEENAVNGNIQVEQHTDALVISIGDFEAAFQEIRPSAMKEVFLKTPKVLWKDVGGQQAIKDALTEAVIMPLKFPEKFAKYGLRPTKGMLLYGPPGCSKTLTAAAMANEAGFNFLAVKGAEVLSKYVGESERNMRDVFGRARAAQPSILFLDEIDAIGSAREESPNGSSGGGGVHVLTTLLNELDGIETMEGVFVLAATNRPWALDPALVRPGRLDEIMYVPMPDAATRRDIFDIRLRSMAHDGSVDVGRLASETEGCSGAEVTELCRRAGLRALRETHVPAAVAGEMAVTQRHFEEELGNLKRHVSVEMIRNYEEWSRAGEW